jgi:hypothetical protein
MPMHRMGAVLLGVALLLGISACDTTPSTRPIDGSQANTLCPDFKVSLGLGDVDVPDPGWVFVDKNQKYRSVTGVVSSSQVTPSDFPASHDSHDQNTLIRVDRGQENILSDVNAPNDEEGVASAQQLLLPTTLEAEWEIGTKTSETGKDAPERTFPRWAWPSRGDRVWLNGAWIFDCGHPKNVGNVGHRRTEIHPARAIASMREVMKKMPGFGLMRVTEADLYIHGRSGVVTDILQCGPDSLVNTGTCSISPEPHRGTPIDENFEFDIRTPAALKNAELQTLVETAPGNTVSVAPILSRRAGGALHVKVPLKGTNVSPSDVYARRIFVGWKESQPARHFRITLQKIKLHEDMELDPTDCECTFFWMSVDRAPNRWFRLVDYQIPTDDQSSFFCPSHVNTMSDWDDDGGCGNGELRFSGPVWDFEIPSHFLQEPIKIFARGYDQDCLDDFFGDHQFSVVPFLTCYSSQNGDNDGYGALDVAFGAPDYGVGSEVVSNNGGQFTAYFLVEELPSSGA